MKKMLILLLVCGLSAVANAAIVTSVTAVSGIMEITEGSTATFELNISGGAAGDAGSQATCPVDESPVGDGGEQRGRRLRAAQPTGTGDHATPRAESRPPRATLLRTA